MNSEIYGVELFMQSKKPIGHLFDLTDESDPKERGKSKHQVDTGRKVKDRPKEDKHLWFLKVTDEDALYEVLAQEFFRLIIPNHPKTRFFKLEDGSYLVASKAVPGFETIQHIAQTRGPNFIYENIKSGKFKGLGMLLIVALFISENDLKAGNLGIANQHFVKIDGDECFVRYRKKEDEKKDFVISEKDISILPRIMNFLANNWLDSRMTGMQNPGKPQVFNEELRTPEFLKEVNEGILSILVLPDALLEQFVRSYVEKLGEKCVKIFLSYFIEMKQNLREEALKNKEFVEYLSSNQPQRFITDYIDQLKKFKTSGKNYLGDRCKNMEENVFNELNTLQTHISLAPVGPPLRQEFYEPEDEPVGQLPSQTEETVAKREISIPPELVNSSIPPDLIALIPKHLLFSKQNVPIPPPNIKEKALFEKTDKSEKSKQLEKRTKSKFKKENAKKENAIEGVEYELKRKRKLPEDNEQDSLKPVQNSKVVKKNYKKS